MLYTEIKRIYELLKESKKDRDLTREEKALSLIAKDDFSLTETRKELYDEESIGDVWGIILLDLEQNLFNNYQKHKE